MSVPDARLIYHPRRQRRTFDSATVYFDSTAGNQDPYVWNDAFLHSYCHITQFHAEVGDVNLWVSGDRFPEFSHLYCDLVFVVARKCLWEDANSCAATTRSWTLMKRGQITTAGTLSIPSSAGPATP